MTNRPHEVMMGRESVVVWVFILLPIIWFLCMPLVNFSSGEGKPRGIFVDEHGFVVNALPTIERFGANDDISAWTSINFTSSFSSPLVSCSLSSIELFIRQQLTLEKGLGVNDDSSKDSPCSSSTSRLYSNDLLEIALEPRNKPSRLEVSVVVVPLYTYGTNTEIDIGTGTSTLFCDEPVELTVAMLRFLLEAPWLARNVLFLLTTNGRGNTMPTSKPTPMPIPVRYSTPLQSWLSAYHNTPSPLSQEQGQGQGRCQPRGLIRDALILDLPIRVMDRDRNRDRDKVRVRDVDRDTSHTIIQVLSTGIDGLQANMDALAVALTVAPSGSNPLSSSTSSSNLHYKRTSSVGVNVTTLTEADPDPYPYYDSDSDPNNSGGANTNRGNIGSNSKNAMPSYHTKLYGLLRHMWVAATGPNGLHAQFLRHDIDAITIRLIPNPNPTIPKDTHTISSNSVQDGFRIESDVLPGLYIALLDMFISYLHAMSNLHEELHHSLHQYLLLGGSRQFVGLLELTPCATLLLVGLALAIARPFLKKDEVGSEAGVVVGVGVNLEGKEQRNRSNMNNMHMARALGASLLDCTAPWVIVVVIGTVIDTTTMLIVGVFTIYYFMVLLILSNAPQKAVNQRGFTYDSIARSTLHMNALGLLVVLSFTSCYSFALGFSVSVVTVPVMTWLLSSSSSSSSFCSFSSSSRSFGLTSISIVYNPLLLLIIYYIIDPLLLDQLAQTWGRSHSITLPIVLTSAHMCSVSGLRLLLTPSTTVKRSE